MFKKQDPATPDDLDARIDALLAEREVRARQQAEEAWGAEERARQAELTQWRQSRIATDERTMKDHADLRELTDRLDRERAEAIDRFWKERAGG